MQAFIKFTTNFCIFLATPAEVKKFIFQYCFVVDSIMPYHSFGRKYSSDSLQKIQKQFVKFNFKHQMKEKKQEVNNEIIYFKIKIDDNIMSVDCI